MGDCTTCAAAYWNQLLPAYRELRGCCTLESCKVRFITVSFDKSTLEQLAVTVRRQSGNRLDPQPLSSCDHHISSAKATNKFNERVAALRRYLNK